MVTWIIHVPLLVFNLFSFCFFFGNYTAGTPNLSGKVLKWLMWLCFLLWKNGIPKFLDVIGHVYVCVSMLCMSLLICLPMLWNAILMGLSTCTYSPREVIVRISLLGLLCTTKGQVPSRLLPTHIIPRGYVTAL